MYSLDHLLEDVLRHHGPLTKRGADYAQVWDAFNRYVTVIIEKRQTLNVLNFCKIGWRIDEHMHGKAKMRPHFQVADAFARAHSVDTKSQTLVPDRLLTTIEEFNFSKAAIKYSQNLTKDNIFMGLRAILQHLGEAVSTGQQVSIDFEVGKLLSSERVMRFVFVAELYLQEGLDVPAGALEVANYKPSATFAPPSKDALSLSLQGNSAAMTMRDRETGEVSSEYAESESTGYPSSTHSNVSVHGLVQQEALDRHLAHMSMEAASAVTEKEQWEGHLKRCSAEERKDHSRRKAINKEHALHLQAQMRQAEEKRMEGRLHCIEQASCHDFPNFAEVPEYAYQYIRERRNHLKHDLDQQVDTKQLKKLVDKQREKEIDAMHIEASNRELALMKLEAAAKKESERAALTHAWEKDKHIHTVRKAIQEHHKAPTRQGNEMLMQLGALPSPRLDTGGPPSARPLTGSVRRMPLGAAASLALHKEKLNAALKR